MNCFLFSRKNEIDFLRASFFYIHMAQAGGKQKPTLSKTSTNISMDIALYWIENHFYAQLLQPPCNFRKKYEKMKIWIDFNRHTLLHTRLYVFVIYNTHTNNKNTYQKVIKKIYITRKTNK